MNISLSFVKKSHDSKLKSLRRFNEWSKKYDRSILQFLVFQRSHDMFISHIAKDVRPLRVLDVGCGTGEFAMKLKKYRNDINVHGVDISDEMISVARGKSEFNEDIEFRIGDVEKMPYDNNYFDYVTCAHSFHHYPSKVKAVREMFRVLKNQGKVMIIDGCKDGLFGKLIFDLIVKKREIDVRHLHSNQFRRILGKTGFRDIAQIIFNPFIPLLFTRAVASKEIA